MPEPEPSATSWSSELSAHQVRMDRMYRPQLSIYDATRRWYLLGRNAMLGSLQPRAGDSVLEIGCGTGRNLLWLADRHPRIRLFGADISQAMLSAAAAATTRHGAGSRVRLAMVAAESLDVRQSFGVDHVDHVVFSYSLSMMPDWRAALSRGFDALRPGGTVHVVDFGDLAEWPAAARVGMRAWLSLFGVHSSRGRCGEVAALSRTRANQVSVTPVARHYAWRLQATTAARGPARPGEA